MSTAKERQAKRRAKIKADPELYQAQLLKDREQKKRQRETQREKMSALTRGHRIAHGKH